MTKKNRYTFLSRKTLKPAKIGSVATRWEARYLKNITGREVVIFDRQLNKVVR